MSSSSRTDTFTVPLFQHRHDALRKPIGPARMRSPATKFRVPPDPLRCRSARGIRHDVRKDLLHLIGRVAESFLYLESLLDLVRRHERVVAILHEAGTMVVADELGDGREIRFPIFGEAFEIHENRVDAGLGEDGYGIVAVLVKISIED